MIKNFFQFYVYKRFENHNFQIHPIVTPNTSNGKVFFFFFLSFFTKFGKFNECFIFMTYKYNPSKSKEVIHNYISIMFYSKIRDPRRDKKKSIERNSKGLSCDNVFIF